MDPITDSYIRRARREEITEQDIILHARILAGFYEDNEWIDAGNARYRHFNRVLYIGGADDWKDWAQNAQLWPTKYLGGYAHGGQVLHAELIEEALEIDLIELSRVTMVCGHSLGGAAAELLGLKYHIPFISWGAPNVWCSLPPLPKAAQTLPTLRIWDRSDIVASLPPGHLGWQNHPGPTIEYGDPWWWGWWRFLFSKSTRAHRYHRMSHYLNRAQASYKERVI